MNHTGKHLCWFFPIFPFVSKTWYDTRLIMIAPKQCIPCISPLHSHLPFFKDNFQFHIIRFHKFPLVSILIIHFQVMEIKTHRQLFFFCTWITDTMFKRCRWHLPYCYIIFNSCISYKFFQIFMNVRSVCIKFSSVSFKIIFPNLRLRNQIHYIKTKAFYTFCFPKTNNFFQLFSDFRIFPVQICLCHIK